MMDNNGEYKSLISKLEGLEKMYHHMRVVDPVNKRVMRYREGSLINSGEICHKIWANQEICENCVSMRAYNEDDTIIKMEYTPERIYMVMAVPVENNGSKIIIELLKDVTGSMIMEDGSGNNFIEIKALLDETNLKAVKDFMTGAYNKRYLLERLPVEITEAHLNNKDLSIIMADIDHFKNINDTLGHLAGDFILKEFALILQENIREEKDWLARFGGEEFVLCLPETDKVRAEMIAERARKLTEDKDFVYNENTINITSSFGVCSLADIETKGYNEMIDCVDKSLYKAKSTGRNCVICAN